jgi:hypothetical protein
MSGVLLGGRNDVQGVSQTIAPREPVCQGASRKLDRGKKPIGEVFRFTWRIEFRMMANGEASREPTGQDQFKPSATAEVFRP